MGAVMTGDFDFMQIGDRFSLAEEGIFGVIEKLFRRDGHVVSCVVKMDCGGWASVDLSKVVLITPTVH